MALFDLQYPAHEHKSPRSFYRGTSLQDFYKAFPTEDACLRHVFETRFGKKPTCPCCGLTCTWSRARGKNYVQFSCKKILSPKANTIFDRSRIPLQIWFYAMLYFCNCIEGTSAPELSRNLGISVRSAYRMGRRIRLQMAALDRHVRIGRPGGKVEVGIEVLRRTRVNKPNHSNRSRVLFLCDGHSVQSVVTYKARSRHILEWIKRKCAPDVSLFTKRWDTYRAMEEYGRRKPIAEFLPDFSHDPKSGETSISSFLKFFHLNFKDRYATVQRNFLWLYLKEYEFRYNRRLRGQEMFWDLVSSFPRLQKEEIAELEAFNSQLPDWN